jgi:putative transposase
MILTYRYRVKSLQGDLKRQARAVNFVWNYLNDAQRHAVRWGKRWPSGYDLGKLAAGSSKELGLLATTIDKVCHQYARSRQQHRRPWLRWRGKKSLGWVPIKAGDLKPAGDGFRFAGKLYRVFMSRPLPEGAIVKEGSNFSQDARGNWFLNVVVEVAESDARPMRRAVGIDLGLKDLAALSTGEIVANPRQLQQLAAKLATAQRARKQRQVTNINARIKSARRDFLHKLSARIVREFDYIAVGDVAPARLAKTSMAKSVLDAGWATLRNQLRYKAIGRGVTYLEVSERLTSQTCSACGCLPASRPEGIAGLRVREWRCDDCGTTHNRDVNAARNILLRSRHGSPAVGAMAA